MQAVIISSINSTVNGAIATSSPIKKKLSLSDYTKSRMNKAAVKPSLSLISTKPSPSEADEIKLENVESATMEKVEGAVATPTAAAAATTNGHTRNV